MSKILSRLIDRSEDEVKTIISRLEATHGYPSVDVRLLAEIAQSARQKMAQLGLDPKDTTGEELYYALQAKFDQDSWQIDRAIGITTDMSLKQRINRAVDFVKRALDGSEIFTLKNVSAKNLLRAVPPKKTMARLHFRSLESMLKRQDLAKVLLLAQYIESVVWQKALVKYASRLSAVDYQRRPANFVVLEKSPNIGPSNLAAVSRLSGSVALWPDQKLQKASGLHLALLLLQGLDELGISAPPKAIAHAHPVLNWWADTSHVISLHDGQPVSFNLYDVAANYLYAKNYTESLTGHGGKSLWKELENRYSRLAGEILYGTQAQTTQKNRRPAVPTAAQLAEELASV